MAAKFDAESLLAFIKTTLENGLTAKLAQISTEKNDGLLIPVLASTAYYLNHLPRDGANEDPWLIYGISGVAPTALGTVAAKRYEVFVIIGTASHGNNQDEDVERILYRYARAVSEIMMENFDQMGGYTKPKVEEYPASPELILESGETYRYSGIVVSATIA